MIAAASIITAVKSELFAYAPTIQNDYLCKSILAQLLYQLHSFTGIDKVSFDERDLVHTDIVHIPDRLHGSTLRERERANRYAMCLIRSRHTWLPNEAY